MAPQGGRAAEEQEYGRGDLAAADEKFIGEGVTEEGPGDGHGIHVHYGCIQVEDAGGELNIHYFSDAIIDDGIGEEIADQDL